MATDMQKWIGRTARLEEEVKGLSGGPQLAKSSIENGAVLEYDETGQLVSSIGKQYDGSHVAVPLAGPVPPVPVEAECQSAPGVIEARWNGKFANALVSTLDWSHLAAYVGDTADFEPDWSKQEATIRGELGDVALFARPAGTYYVRLASWSRTGKHSEASAAVEVIVPEVADGDAIAEALDQIDLSLAAVQDAVNGVNKVINATTDPDAGGGSAGDRWQKWTTLELGGKLLKAWRWDGTAWIPELMDPSYLPLVDIGQGTFGELDGQRLKAKSATIGSLMIGSLDNLVQEPDFTANGQGWATLHSSASVVPSVARNGGPALSFAPVRVDATSYAQRIPAFPGASYRFSVWVKADVAQSGDWLWAGIRFVRESGAYAYAQASQGTMAAGVWTKVSMIAKAPDDAVAMDPRVGARTGTSGTLLVDLVSVIRASDASLVVDGAFDARTITGPLIQTSAAALAGVKLGPNGLEGFNGLSRTFYLNPTTGAVELTGTITAGSSIQGATITGAAITGGNIKMEDGNGYSVELSTTSNSAFARFRTPTSADATYNGGTIRGEEDTWYGDPRTSTVIHSPTSRLFDIRGSLRLTAGRSSHPSMARDYEGRAYLNSQLIMEPNSADAKITTVAGKRLIVGPLDGDMILGGKNTDISSWTTGKVTINGNPFAGEIMTGSFTVGAIGPDGGNYQTTVTLPAGRFTGAPSVTALTGSPRTTPAIDRITKTSFRIRLYNFTTANAPNNDTTWMAINNP